jgi:hypothetical protein
MRWCSPHISASSASNSCFLYYNAAAAQINLLNDAGTAWMTATPGAATTLQNNQCSLNVAAATAALNSNRLTLNLAMTSKPAYAGAKNIYPGVRSVVRRVVLSSAALSGLSQPLSSVPGSGEGFLPPVCQSRWQSDFRYAYSRGEIPA